VTKAHADGLSPRSIKKYHASHARSPLTSLNVSFTHCPRSIGCWSRHLLRPECAGARSSRCGHDTSISCDAWVSVEDTIVETSKKNSPTGERFLVKRYPKNNEPRTFGVRQAWLDEVAAHIRTKSIAGSDLLFTTRVGTPISRKTFRTQVWLPTVRASGVDFSVRIHDLRHAHASWLLAGGSDLRSVMERMGHHQIQTTQKYLHALPDADRKNLDALVRIARGKGHLTTVRHADEVAGALDYDSSGAGEHPEPDGST
jgi:Phage integrase family